MEALRHVRLRAIVPGSRIIIFLCLVILHGLAESSPGRASSESAGDGSSRPKVGLALSGGGARGAAHIGVLKVLERLRVPVDFVAGTSMGAVVGGLFASGMSPDDIEAEMNAVDWGGVFLDALPRPVRTFRQKLDDRLSLTKFRPGVKGSDVRAPTALVQGLKFDLELKRLTRDVTGIDDFSGLPIPFRAIATDIVTGEEVVLQRGDLALAMRASMSVPGVFAGVKIDGRLLVDGGVSNNLPINVVREMGADVVIAVDISAPLHTEDDLDTAITVIDQLANLLTRRNVDLQTDTLRVSDVLILPDMQGIGSADFDKLDEAVARGVLGANRLEGKLSGVTVGETEYRRYLSRMHRPAHPSKISFVKIENETRLSDALLNDTFGVAAGDPFDIQAIQRGVGRLFGLDIFENVRYDLIEDERGVGVVVQAEERSWGTDALQFGFDLYADADSGDSRFNLAAAYTMKPVNSLNGEWRSYLKLGEDAEIFTEIYQPLDAVDGYFVRPKVYYRSDRFDWYEGDSALIEYDVRRLGIQLSLGRALGNWGRLEMGVERYTGDLDILTGPKGLSGDEYDGGGHYLLFQVDTFDNIYFPREGLFAEFGWRGIREAFGADSDFDQIDLRSALAFSRGEDTLLGLISLGLTPNDDAPIQDQFRLGGFLRISGLQDDQLLGQQRALALLGYMRRVYPNPILPVYAGLTLEAGNTWPSLDEIDGLRFGGSLFLGSDTPLGPLYLGYGYSEGGEQSLYLVLRPRWFD